MAGNRGDSLLGEALEASAYTDLFRNAPAEFAQSTSLAFRAIGRGCVISLPPALTFVLNRIQGLHGLDELKEAYGWLERRTGTHYLQINPELASAEVPEWLDSKRLIKENPNWSKLMWRGDAVDEYPSKDLRIQVATAQDADVFGSITAKVSAFLPPLAGYGRALSGRIPGFASLATGKISPLPLARCLSTMAALGWAWAQRSRHIATKVSRKP